MRTSLSAPEGLGLSKGGGGELASLTTGLGSPDYHLPFFHYLAIPKSTTQISPLTFDLTLPIGIINRIWLEFPRGCSGLAGVQVWRGIQQVFPLPAGTWFRSDNAVFNFAFTHDVTTEPYEITLKGYNDDDTYQHTVWVALEMSGQKSDLPPQLQGLIDYLRG